ncbi:MAG: histidine--tRNA ligase [Bacteroidota bacterium]
MKPSIPKGTRDFGPELVARRQFIFDTLRKVFIRHGYRPIETPTMENLSTLTGKYGEEGDKLLFKVLNNGDYLAKADAQALEDRNSAKLTASISKRGLRYDLTVPFARYVVMHQHEISLPFKRYQIQPVWRADRPQKGRYQEFYQCDVDIVGSYSLMNEAEFIQIYDEAFSELGLNVEIKLNNRKVLNGMAEAVGISDRFMEMTTAIDKLDKIGLEGVKTEMEKKGISQMAIDQICDMLQIQSLADLKTALQNSEVGLKGVEELETVYSYLNLTSTNNDVVFDITLARGLNYYTGCIFEVKAKDVKIGSIGGGGRYDDLTGVFGLKGLGGVGVSFGAARIFDVMTELDLFPKSVGNSLQVLLVAFDPETHLYAFKCLQQLHRAGINAELYPEPAKMKKQMKYANSRAVPFVILIGSNEMESGMLSIKNMEAGTQDQQTLEEIIQRLNAATNS